MDLSGILQSQDDTKRAAPQRSIILAVTSPLPGSGARVQQRHAGPNVETPVKIDARIEPHFSTEGQTKCDGRISHKKEKTGRTHE